MNFKVTYRPLGSNNGQVEYSCCTSETVQRYFGWSRNGGRDVGEWSHHYQTKHYTHLGIGEVSKIVSSEGPEYFTIERVV